MANAPETPQIYEQRELIKKLKFDADAFRKEYLGKTIRVMVGVDKVADLGELFNDPNGGMMFVSWGAEGAGNTIAVNFEKADGLRERLRGMSGEVVEVEGVVSGAGVTDSLKLPAITITKATVIRIR